MTTSFWSHLWTITVDITCSHPIICALVLLAVYLIYVVIKFDEIVIDFKEQVPAGVRKVPDQHRPPCYPNGWIPILESRTLGLNEVKSVIAFGQELAVIRGASGDAYVIDAYCPHLGANLAVGGTVYRDVNCQQDCIRCPFHGWSFRMDDGQCADIPYEEGPVNAKVKLWPSLEMNNVIFVWHHADGEPPNWKLEAIEEIKSSQWHYRGRTEHLINCHLQEIPENGADIAHLGEIHVDPVFLGSDLSLLYRAKAWRFFTHHWTAQWTPCSPPDGHMSHIDLVNHTRLFGFNLFSVFFDVHQIGPAYVVLRFKTNLFGIPVQGAFLQFLRPIGPMRNAIIHQVYTDSSLAAYIFSKFLIFAESKMLERDIQIWNRKAFLSKPYLAKSEKALAKYRRWYTQFYSEGSKREID